MPGISFDRAADYYDATRGYAPGTAERIRDAVIAQTQANAGSRLLELGVGTGRIALPFIQAGYRYAGIDLSGAMLAALRRKLAAIPGRAPWLAQADMMQLPFADGVFDVILAVHVLHLVEDWRQVLREARRVLRRPGGRLVLAHDESHRDAPAAYKTAPLPPSRQVQDVWTAILADLGEETPRFRMRPDDPQLAAHLQEMGATTRSVWLTDYELPAISARAVIERFRSRIYSSDWTRPDDIHAEALRRIEHWLAHDCPDPDHAAPVTGRFMALVATWDA